MFNKHVDFVILKDDVWYSRQKHAGHCVASVLEACGNLVTNKQPNLSLRDLESEAIKIINEQGCSPTFKGYKGFPSAICTSVNEHLVHGIVTEYVLKDGDIITIDLGATYEGAIGDAASTFVYGNTKSKEATRMIDLCKQALYAGIKAIKVGSRLGVIGDAIHKLVKDSGFGLIVNYGGHGINYNTPHAPPFVSNRSSVNDGIRIQPGLSIAIEPMLVMGDTKTHILNDNWTVVASGISCHHEHSVFITNDSVHIMTEKENDAL